MREKRIGLMLWPAPDLDAGFERGVWAEAHGYDDVWLADSEGLQDPIALAAAIGVATERIRLGTGVVPVFNRAPAVLATGVIAAEQRAPGRFVLGLGASTANMIDRWYGVPYERPLTRVRETVALLRAIFAGEKSDFSGATVRSRGFRLQEQPSAPIPIFLGAMGPKMLQLAGEIGDGVVLNDFTPPDRLDWALEQVDAGARRAGRRAEDLEIVKRRAFLVTDDEHDALEFFRQYLGYYASARAYQEIMIALGYGDAMATVRRGYEVRDRALVSSAISDAMVARLFAFGAYPVCRALVDLEFEAGVDTVIVSPQTRDAAEYAQTAAAFSRSEPA